MKIQLVLLFFILNTHVYIFSQGTFNTRLDVSEAFGTIATNVEVSDSCYFICGIMVDSSQVLRSFFGKLDLNGNPINFKQITNDSIDFELWDETLNRSGNSFYVAGRGNGINGRQTCFIKLSAQGEVEFHKWIPKATYSFSYPSPRAMTPFQGGWLLVEQFRNLDRNRLEARVLHLDIDGNILWETKYADSFFSFRPRSIKIDSSGFLIGGGKGNLDYVLQNQHDQTVILKFGMDGQLKWKFESQPGWSSAESIELSNDGGQIIGARKGIPLYVNSSVDLFQIQHLIIKLDKNHNVEWSRLMRNSYLHEFNNLEKVIDTKGGIVYCGHLNDETVGFLGVLGKVSHSGDSLWMRSFMFETDSVYCYGHMLNDLEMTSDGGFVFTGQTQDGTPPKYQYGWAVKVDSFGCLIPGCQISSTEEPDSKFEVDLSIYPNPTSNFLNFLIREQAGKNLIYRITNLEGKVMYRNETIKSDITYVVPVSYWPNGTYQLQIFENNFLLGAKSFIVEK
ncbi:MAG: T9SS type A sorting domain-containing protein [Saprospiraceae bacterium]